MALKFKMDSLDGVDAAVAALYTKGEGTDNNYYLTGVAGVVPKTRIDEFRNNNVELSQKLEQFKDIDPKKYVAMTKEVDDLRKQLTASGRSDVDIEKIIGERVTTMKTEFEGKETGYVSKIQTMSRQLESLMIDNTVRAAAIEHGVTETAVDDVIMRAKAVFKIENDVVVGYDGDKKLYDVDGTKPMPIGSWVKNLTKVAPHLFKKSSGAELRPGATFKGDPGKMTAVQKIAAGIKNK